MHTLGFAGHSPYKDSGLYPFIVPAYRWRRWNKDPISPLGQRMVEMLYRPEILPGMTIKEAGEILIERHHSEAKPPNTTLNDFLSSYTQKLHDQKKRLINQVKENFEERNQLYRQRAKALQEEESLVSKISGLGLNSNFIETFFDTEHNTPRKLNKRSNFLQELTLIKKRENLLQMTDSHSLPQNFNPSPIIFEYEQYVNDQLDNLEIVVRRLQEIEQRIREVQYTFLLLKDQLRRVERQLLTLGSNKTVRHSI